MFRKSILGFAVAAVTILPAFAADTFPVKAKFDPLAPYPSQGCGMYYGLLAQGGASPIKDGPTGGTILSGTVGGTVGWTCNFASRSTFWFAEVIGGFQNLNGASNGLSLSGPLHFEQRLGIGGPINDLLSLLPNLNFPAVPVIPTLPNGITAGPSKGYVFVGLMQDDISAQYGAVSNRQWLVAPEVGIGMLTRLSNNVVVDTWVAAVLQQSQGVCLGGTFGCPGLSNGFRTGVALKY